MRGESEAVILHLDGRVRVLDARRWAVGSTIFQVASKFQATDLAAGVGPTGAVICLTVNDRFATTDGSFLLQVPIAIMKRGRGFRLGAYTSACLDIKRGVA
jgi:hypothetical protein